MSSLPPLDLIERLSEHLQSTFLELPEKSPHLNEATLQLIASDAALSLSPLTWEHPPLGMKGARGLDGLETLSPELRLHVLTRLQPHLPCSPTLSELAAPCERFLSPQAPWPEGALLPALTPVQKGALGLWLGLSSDVLELGEAPPDIQRQVLQLALTPYSREAFSQGMALLPDTTALLAAQRLTIGDPLALLDCVSAPQDRLLVALYLAAQGQCSASELIAEVEEDWQDAQTPLERALADARLAGLAALDEDPESALGLLRHALMGFDREQQPEARRALYESCLLAASHLPTPEPFLNLVERLSNERLVLRSRESFARIRTTLLRLLTRQDLARTTFERALLNARDLERRLPDSSLELLRLSIACTREYQDQRSSEVLLTDIGKSLRDDRTWQPNQALALSTALSSLPLPLLPALLPALPRISKLPARLTTLETLLYLSLGATLRP